MDDETREGVRRMNVALNKWAARSFGGTEALKRKTRCRHKWRVHFTDDEYWNECVRCGKLTERKPRPR